VQPQPADSRTAPHIGRYLITGRIGRGGMGMVYRGLDPALEREVAVKTLVSEGSFDPESRKRFEVEAKAAAKLQHPNIVTVYDVGEDRGILFIVMEVLPGADLDSLLRSGETLPLTEKLDVLAQVCRGLALSSTATSSRATCGCSTTAPRRSWTSGSPSSAPTTTSPRPG
jgi:serine/threonine protein kinase